MPEIHDDDPALREAQFLTWAGAGLLPELKAGVQQRSLRTAFSLLEAGARLLRERAFDALGVQEICAAAGATEGAFYGRFADKTAYFAVLQNFLSAVGRGPQTLEAICTALAEMTLRRYRENLGIYRAALKHSAEGSWEPFRQLGDRYRQALTALLSPLLPEVPEADRAMHVRFAYQVMIGTLVHATLNDPGPLRLDDPRMVRELARMMTRYLEGVDASGMG